MSKTKMYRLKVGEHYCSLNTHLHTEGVAIPDCSRRQAEVVEHVNTANAIIRRTHTLREDVKKSMLSDFVGFKPLLFEGMVEHEEFQPDKEDES
jgi:hypothetical protein